MNLSKFKALIKSQFKKLFSNSNSSELSKFCTVGDLESIKKTIKINSIFPPSSHMFSIACTNGHLPIVEYMLLPENKTVFSGIYNNKNKALQVALIHKHLDVAKYLSNHTTFRNYIDIHAEDDSTFKQSCINEDTETIQFLVFSLKINKTKEIEKFIEKFPNLQGVKIMQSRENYEQLTKELNTGNVASIYKKKNKI